MKLFKYIFALLFFISPVKETEASDLANAITKEELIAVINDDNTITDLKTSILFKEIKQNMVSSMLAAEAEAYDGNVMALLAIKLLDWGIKGIDQYQLDKNRWDSNAGNYDPFLPDPYRNAYICGLYNGLLKEAKAIPELAHLLIKISTSEKNRQQFSEEIEKLLEEGVLTTIAEGLIKKYGNKPAHELSYYAGETTITVATFFVSFGAVTKGGKITNLVKLVNPLQDAIGVLNKVSKAGLVLQRSGQVFLLKTVLEANVFLAKIDAENVFKEVRWLNEGQVVEQLKNITYIDNGVQKTASLTLVKQGNEVGFRMVDVLGDVIRGVSKNDFINSVSDFAGKPELADEAWELFKQERWADLENLINTNNINGGWPPNNGFKNIIHTEIGSELVGKTFDRFQGYEDLGGKFASPIYSGEGVEDLVFTYDSRALNSQIPEGTYYIKFKLKENLPSDLKFEYGEAIPWFNTVGNADQIKSSINLRDLKLGVDYEILEKLQYINGSWIVVP